MKKGLLWAALLSFCLTNGQFSVDLFKDIKARNIGPGGMSGRITAIDAVHDDPSIIYAGSASGGLWKSTSGGIQWTPLFQDQITASIGALAVQQSNPNVIWVGTGEGNPRNSLNGGYGIFKSLDGGKTWKAMGLEKTRNIHRILIDPLQPNTLYVAAIGSPWGEHPERGVYKTTDGGKSWNKVLSANNKTGAADLVMDPTNPNKLIAALWEHKRDPWFFNSGGPGSGLHMTIDGGATWKKLTEENGLPKGILGRMGVAIAPSNSNRVYALIEAKKNGLYRSDDGGENWSLVNDKKEIGNRPFYYSDIRVDPENENRLYSIFTYVNVSEDGGKSFKELMPAYNVDNGVHPDHHAWWIHPKDGRLIINGNDGGLNISRDRGANWRFVGNLPVGQFYHINTDMDFPYNVYGGMQDNGSWKGPAYVWRDQGIRNSYWQEILFGDGFDVIPNEANPRFGFAMSQQGNVSRYDAETGNNYTIKPTHPDPDMKLRFNWNAAIAQDPFDAKTLYFGSQFVHKSEDEGLTWKLISPDLTSNDKSRQRQSESGGLTLDATGAENFCTLLVIEPSPIEEKMLWTASDDGRVHYTIDGGTTWNDVTKNIKGLPAGSWIPQIKASTYRKGAALLVANDYRRFNYTPYVFQTTNYGKTWKRIVDTKDVSSYALSIVQDPVAPNLFFLGTDDGLYLSIDGAKSWQKMPSDVFPTVSTKDLVIHKREPDLIIGTFGRAIWILDDIGPLRKLAQNSNLIDTSIHLFDAPKAYHTATQQPNGTRFGGDAMFNGENRPEGGRFTFYFNPEKTNPVSDSISLQLFLNGKSIKTLEKKAPKEKGLYRWNWDLTEEAPQRPQRKQPQKKREGRGKRALAGAYTAVVAYNGKESKASIDVALDPRGLLSQEAFVAAYQYTDTLEQMTELAAKAVTQLIESKKRLTVWRTSYKENKLPESIDLVSNELSEEIDLHLALFLGKEDKRQGIVRSPKPNVMTRLNKARYYIQSRPNGLTTTEKDLLSKAQEQMRYALEAVNLFYAESWPRYEKTKASIPPLPQQKIVKFTLD
ncbi:MAG: WD40/YVTN/BNR-like repeat-containing protein [Flavobacteriaceae bacterium]